LVFLVGLRQGKLGGEFVKTIFGSKKKKKKKRGEGSLSKKNKTKYGLKAKKV